MAHILVVEDEPDLAALVAFNLRQANFEVNIAETGEQALAASNSGRSSLRAGVNAQEMGEQVARFATASGALPGKNVGSAGAAALPRCGTASEDASPGRLRQERPLADAALGTAPPFVTLMFVIKCQRCVTSPVHEVCLWQAATGLRQR